MEIFFSSKIPSFVQILPHIPRKYNESVDESKATTSFSFHTMIESSCLVEKVAMKNDGKPK